MPRLCRSWPGQVPGPTEQETRSGSSQMCEITQSLYQPWGGFPAFQRILGLSQEGLWGPGIPTRAAFTLSSKPSVNGTLLSSKHGHMGFPETVLSGWAPPENKHGKDKHQTCSQGTGRTESPGDRLVYTGWPKGTERLREK